jgi:superfamily II DNA or RNA helicase
MLTEGWDANNVTHILGVRAFGSQLLCEQVVGRGLRRMDYTPDPATGLLTEEYVDVYGIPFSVIPFKGRAVSRSEPDDRPKHHVRALPERKQFEMRFPVVELVRLTDGTTVVLEIKGYTDEKARAKHSAARRWVEAVNNWGELGRWVFHVCRNPLLLERELHRLANGMAASQATDADDDRLVLRG